MQQPKIYMKFSWRFW